MKFDNLKLPVVGAILYLHILLHQKRRKHNGLLKLVDIFGLNLLVISLFNMELGMKVLR